MTAILPDALIAPRRRFLRELAPGETGVIGWLEMKVLADRTCFLNLGAELRDGGASVIEVKRGTDGSYHVTVPSNHTYEPGRHLPLPEQKIEPVASITIGEPK